MKFYSIGMNADLSDQVKFHALSFSNISGTIKFKKIARITWDWKCTIVRKSIRWFPKEGNQVGFTSKRENTPNFFWDCFHC